MKFITDQLITKLSVSDLSKSRDFYEKILGFQLDPKYSIIKAPDEIPYLQMNLACEDGSKIILGLYKDIDAPFNPLPSNGTVPSFLVKDIEATLTLFQKNQVVIDEIEGSYILSNTSDLGYEDKFFFFRDPDYNSLVIRENILKI
ncbi:VOC family protein [Algoriphagus machipongonensis]|uniref:GloA protein n=1 Tax=Algoriphagus machipongonensis TaxID=388413 RepID=A3HZ38_9BACT|nr:VOC family protein [Algoriphagus machipongonensis]EAZ80524.1 putative GloA protein [Algoriphagus machipongonensis]